MERDDIIKALKEEIEAVDSAEGKGVAAKEPKEMKTPSDATKTEKVKLDGGGGTVGGDAGGVEKGGKAAEGADKPAVEKADGKSVASASVTVSKDLKGMDNAVGESITLPHDVLVEQDGKQMTIKAGTKVRLVKEEEECKEEEKEEKEEKKEECKESKEAKKQVVKEETPDFLKDEGGEAEEGVEGMETFGGADLPDGGEGLGLPEPEAEVSGEIEQSSLDKIVDSLETLADGFREFAKEEQGEEEHGGEEAGEGVEEMGGEEAGVKEVEEKENAGFEAQLESIQRKGKLVK